MTEKKQSTASSGPLGLTYGEIGLLLGLVVVLAVGLILLWAALPSEPRVLVEVSPTPVPSQARGVTLTQTPAVQSVVTLLTSIPASTEALIEPAPDPSGKAVTANLAPTNSPSLTLVEDILTPSSAPNPTLEAISTRKVSPTPSPPAAMPTATHKVATGTLTPNATDTLASTLSPPNEVLTGVMVFPVYDPAAGTYNIYAAKPDGSERRLVVAEASQPTLNSSGDRIAYRSWAQNRGLLEQGLEGEEGWQFNFYGEAARPAFAPDDQSFLFHSREGGEPPAIYHTSGTSYYVLRRINIPIQGESPAWLPDGRFVYKGWLDSEQGLILSNLDGSFPKPLITDHSSDAKGDTKSDTNPAVSPDGGSVVFMSARDGDWDVFKVNIDGTGLMQLTTDPANNGLPTWSPDGETIAFVSDRGGEWAMWAMDGDGSNQRLLFELGGSIDGVVKVEDKKKQFGWLEERIDWAP
jgi:Tol biopolymer transport system component